MKRTVLILIGLLPYLLFAQSPVKKKKYPSLLWEISGNGLKKRSFLFGTMHVSSKMAFHLADSFYIGIRNADMVALETNPESWQEDMSKYEFDDNGYTGQYERQFNHYMALPDDYLTMNTLKIYKYDKKIESSLYSNPSTINNLLYRSYGNESSDFEEDTYLDMYIYQCGKKWGKKVAGVEKYGESMKLMLEAYKDAAKDKNKKDRSYDLEDGYSSGNLQEAYRTGNLDWLDSINRYNSFSSAFDEKFLYRRNEIQAESIDSILKTGQSLFVGVGAAHLPGTRGVIEILRDMGYSVRPVKMGERDSQHKNQVEKLRVPVRFATQSAGDGMYSVDIPGKFYRSGDESGLQQEQYADMANGSYYMVTRIMTNAWMWGHSNSKVYKVIDSLLYENIPGRIVSKTTITRNGYKGIDLVNRTRRGDIQRYNIFITGFEVIVFKMSGTGDYVRNGEEAKRFFGSIRLREELTGWKKYSPSYGGFAVDFPHEPYIGNNGSMIYDATDKITHTQYRVIRTDIHNYHFAEEDTFDLALMEESFAASDFTGDQLSRKHLAWKGYPALDASYKNKNGGIYLVRFIIQGPHYYTLLAHGKQETAGMKNFLNSFEIKPYNYGEPVKRVDTFLYYTVESPVFPEPDKERLDIPRLNYQPDEEEESEEDILANGTFRNKIIANDTTGEKIFVSFFKSQRYVYIKDSTSLDRENQRSVFGDSNWIVKLKKNYELSDQTRVWELVVTDTGSSRTIWRKTFYKNGIGYALMTQSDTLSQPSRFVRSFFESFTPADTLKGISPFNRKSALFFADLMSKDTATRQRAIKGIYIVDFDSTDLPRLKEAISSLNWNEKKYLSSKKSFIGKLDGIRTQDASDYLKTLYYASGDTVELQYTILEVLLQQKTQYAFNVFRDIVASEPPVLNVGSENKWSGYPSVNLSAYPAHRFKFDNGNFMDELYDSLELTRTILPSLLPLLNLDDYKFNIMQLLSQMAERKLVKAEDYDEYFNKFFLEAKQELKKQAIAEKKKAIDKAEQEKENRNDVSSFGQENKEYGNQSLGLYATLLIPFTESNPNVQPVIDQLFSSNDNRLKYRALLLLLRNNKPYPDSLPGYFARMDDYRYELYTDLKELKKDQLFPASFNNHLDLGKSKLLGEKSYGKPDSLVYLDKLKASVKGRNGVVYFFKYKARKDDAGWKLATVGLLPEDTARFEFEELQKTQAAGYEDEDAGNEYNFTGFRNTRIKEGQSLATQLNSELKKMLYSRRNSAAAFYSRDNNRETYETVTVGDDYEE